VVDRIIMPETFSLSISTTKKHKKQKRCTESIRKFSTFCICGFKHSFHEFPQTLSYILYIRKVYTLAFMVSCPLFMFHFKQNDLSRTHFIFLEQVLYYTACVCVYIYTCLHVAAALVPHLTTHSVIPPSRVGRKTQEIH